jgi:predicted nucleic acid-binding protein
MIGRSVPSGVGVLPRVVLDTNVCLDVFVFDDSAAAVLARLLAQGRVEAVACTACRDEWLRVLEYPALRLGDAARTAAAARYDAGVRLVATPDPAQGIGLPRCADPDDQKFLELAGAVGAAALVSRDHAVLRLDRRARAVAGFAIVRPADVRCIVG